MAIDPLAARFWDLADKTGDCWLWTGRKDKDGYGIFPPGGTAFGTDRAHRIAIILAKGGILPGFVVDHLCFNRACVRPRHLKAISRAENAGITSRSLKTHCKRGHPRTPENIRVEKDGKKCRLCHALLHRESYARKRAERKAS